MGLRPGEKLYEELITEGEGITFTEHKKIMVLRNNLVDNGSLNEKWNKLNEEVNELVALAKKQDAQGIKLKLKEFIPEYTPEFSG